MTNGSSGATGSVPESQIDALLRLLNRPQNSARAAQPAKLIVQAQNRLLLVDQAEICYAAIDEGVIRVVTQNFEGQSKCRTLEELLELLDPSLFWRAHRGFVVNINHIREVVPWFKSTYQLRMNDKKQTEIPVSRAQDAAAAGTLQFVIGLCSSASLAAAKTTKAPITKIEIRAEALVMSATRHSYPVGSRTTVLGCCETTCNRFPIAQSA